MSTNSRLLLYGCVLALVCAVTSPLLGDNPPIPGIGPAGKIKLVKSDCLFTEGPTADTEGNVYFSDVPKNKIYKIDKDGKVELFLDNTKQANGLAVNAKGEIVACEMSGGVVAIDPKDKSVRPLAKEYDAASFNAPNGLVLDSDGGVYFTDPSLGARSPLPQKTTAVYYLAADGKVKRLLDKLPNPKGITLSPDGKTLYVASASQDKVMAYPVEGPGQLGKGKVFCTLKPLPVSWTKVLPVSSFVRIMPQLSPFPELFMPAMPVGRPKKSTAEGLTVDSKGNLYIASQLGLQVFAPEGKLLGVLTFPEIPSNAAFGGADRKTLYVTARSSVYAVPMEVAGPKVAAGEPK
jgi:gluconolactonase